MATPTGEDTEARERRELCVRANVGDVYNSILEKRGATDGATAEAQAAHGCAPNQIPLAMLRTEVRAVTPTPGASQTEQAETVLPVFSTGSGSFSGSIAPASHLGNLYSRCSRRVRPCSGQQRCPRTRQTRPARSMRPYFRPSGFRPDSCTAGRMPCSSRTWIRRLRMALNGGLQEKLDLDAIAGDDGLLTGTNLPNNNVSAITTFAHYLSLFLYGRVDGRYAEMKSDIRVLMGAGTYAHAGGVYQSSAYKSALALLEQDSGGVRVSAHVPAVSNSNKQNAVVRLGLRRDMVQPVWGAVTIIVDEVTKSGAGEIEVTAVLGMNTKILRADGFHKQQSQVS